MATDSFKFTQNNDSSSSPARNALVVTPSDTVDIAIAPKALFVGGAGNISLIPLDGTVAVAFVGITAGSILPIRPSRIMATNTTATNIVALF